MPMSLTMGMLLYQSLVAHYTQGLTGRQCIEIIKRELDDLHFVEISKPRLA